MIILAVLAGTGLLVTGCVERRMSSSQLNVYDKTVKYDGQNFLLSVQEVLNYFIW